MSWHRLDRQTWNKQPMLTKPVAKWSDTAFFTSMPDLHQPWFSSHPCSTGSAMKFQAIPSIESLESRWLPSSNLNAFAQFKSTDFPGAESISVRVAANDFHSPERTPIVGFILRSTADGSIRATSAANGSTQTISAKAGLPGTERGGLTVSILRTQAYSLKLPENSVGANWTLQAFLAGDANADFRVDATDLRVISSRMGKSFGQPGYSPEADVNADGIISASDARMARSNLGVSTTIRPLHLSARLSSAIDPDQNGVVERRQATVVCSAVAGASLSVSMEGQRTRGFRVGNSGLVSFAATLPAGTSICRVLATGPFGQRTSARHEITVGDAILGWNRTHLNTIKDYRHEKLIGAGRNVLTPPPLAARNLAMMHLAMADAVKEAESAAASRGLANPLVMSKVAAAAAARDVMGALYPGAVAGQRFNSTFTECLLGVTPGRIRSEAVAIGKAAAARVLLDRANDGSFVLATSPTGGQPGEWVPTPSGFKAALLPQWPSVTPFLLASADDVLPPPPPALDSTDYAIAFNQVRSLGSKTDSSRTADQTAIALFWADGGGTFTPPGHWNQIAADIASSQGSNLARNAKLFAALNTALADAGIACWKAKYLYSMWRPVTAINRASEDGNDSTEEDSAWRPLIETPPFPTYTSGHSTFSGAAATVLAGFFGDDTPFTARADVPAGQVATIADRTFAGFSEAATEASWSRVFGGIHFLFDGEAGLDSGRLIGELALQTFS